MSIEETIKLRDYNTCKNYNKNRHKCDGLKEIYCKKEIKQCKFYKKVGG